MLESNEADQRISSYSHCLYFVLTSFFPSPSLRLLLQVGDDRQCNARQGAMGEYDLAGDDNQENTK
jgi:hypothetical protein